MRETSSDATYSLAHGRASWESLLQVPLCLSTPRATRMHLVFCHIPAPVFEVQPVVLNGNTRVSAVLELQPVAGTGRRRISSSYRLERVLEMVAPTCFEDGMISGGVILGKVA